MKYSCLFLFPVEMFKEQKAKEEKEEKEETKSEPEKAEYVAPQAFFHVWEPPGGGHTWCCGARL